MWVTPTKTAIALRKGKTNILKQSEYFTLQEGNFSTRQGYFKYRIVTKNYPYYKLAQTISLDFILQYFHYLNNNFLSTFSTKPNLKELIKQFKLSYKEFPIFENDINSISDSYSTSSSSSEIEEHFIEEDIGFNFNEDLNFQLQSDSVPNNSPPETFELKHKNTSEPIVAIERIKESEISTPTSSNFEYNISFNIFLNLILNIKTFIISFWNYPEGIKIINNNKSMLSFPLEVIGLLSYPPIEKKRKSLQLLKEIQIVRNRRRIVLCLTIYTIFMRFCSFDLFLFLLFIANCGVLYVMKNSRKINITLAKRTVKNRVGLAKQWAGGLLSRPKNASPNHSDNYVEQNKNSIDSNNLQTETLTENNKTKIKNPVSYLINRRKTPHSELPPNITFAIDKKFINNKPSVSLELNEKNLSNKIRRSSECSNIDRSFSENLNSKNNEYFNLDYEKPLNSSVTFNN